jgi:catalase
MHNRELTATAGRPIGDNQRSLSAGPRGPIVFEDHLLFEKMAHFNRERIPERVVHAKGSGAYGYFVCTNPQMAMYTTASLFSQAGKYTQVFVRFSTMVGEKGSADMEQDPRGFAVKFYTEQGNWDIVGSNTPVFFIRDPLKFSDLVHAQKRDPQTNLRSPAMMWDFWSHSPESLHQVTILFSDRGIPDGYRHMNGYGGHAFSLTNLHNKLFYVKWHFKTLQDIQCFMREEAERMRSVDPDYAQRDLHTAIAQGNFPKWRVCMQVMPEKETWSCPFNPFDLTKVWPQGDYPLIDVGELVLNRSPENYFAEVEQAAFNPGNIVPGMGYSPDKMLQARLVSYSDAQRYRIGINYAALPVNRPQCPAYNYQRDGSMRFDDNDGKAVNYQPNSFGGPVGDRSYRDRPRTIGGVLGRHDHGLDNDTCTQAGNLFRLMNSGERGRLVSNIIASLRSVPQPIQERQIRNSYEADPRYGTSIAQGVGLDIREIVGLGADIDGSHRNECVLLFRRTAT